MKQFEDIFISLMLITGMFGVGLISYCVWKIIEAIIESIIHTIKSWRKKQ